MKTNKAFEELTQKQRDASGLNGYVKRVREENEATGMLISKLAGTYVPEKWNLRQGSENHTQHYSKGM